MDKMLPLVVVSQGKEMTPLKAWQPESASARNSFLMSSHNPRESLIARNAFGGNLPVESHHLAATGDRPQALRDPSVRIP
jgi:hypothetical protein